MESNLVMMNSKLFLGLTDELPMSILTWNHTRKGTPMKQSGSYSLLMIRVMMVRQIYPNHPMFIDGTPCIITQKHYDYRNWV